MKVDTSETEKILGRLQAHLDLDRKPKKIKEKARLVKLGLREHEAEAWLNQEPDFTRRIFTQKKPDGDFTAPKDSKQYVSLHDPIPVEGKQQL
jgi:hypothetical protein